MTSTAREYASALFLLARESGQEDSFLEALELVDRQFADNPAYVEMLRCPGIPKAERQKALEAAFSTVLPREVLIFLQLLCKGGHMQAFSDCLAEYTAFYRAQKQISVGKVTSATPLTAEEQNTLLARLQVLCGHPVSFEYTVDPTLLGGVTVEIDGKILDGSLRHRLHQVKEVIAK